MKEKLSRNTNEAIRQVLEDFTVDECKALQSELVLGKGQTFIKGSSKAFSNNSWKYLWSEFEDLHYYHRDRGYSRNLARIALANIVVWNRVGNCLKAYHTVPKDVEEFKELEERWLKEHGLEEYPVEPNRALKERLKRLNKSPN